MHLLIAAVGRLKGDCTARQVTDYLAKAAPLLRRLGYTAVEQREVAESRRRTASERRREEATALTRVIGRNALLVALDERGRALDSREFAALLERLSRQSARTLALVIGGPDGLDETFRDQAAETVSLGRMTWPHRLVRLMLAEQLYRAGTIAAGHPYHRD